MDTAKAIGIIIANPEFEDVRSLEGVAPTTKPRIPIIAVPTTAGTAAEVTNQLCDHRMWKEKENWSVWIRMICRSLRSLIRI